MLCQHHTPSKCETTGQEPSLRFARPVATPQNSNSASALLAIMVIGPQRISHSAGRQEIVMNRLVARGLRTRGGVEAMPGGAIAPSGANSMREILSHSKYGAPRIRGTASTASSPSHSRLGRKDVGQRTIESYGHEALSKLLQTC
jgi:hypothetical protein